ncbi:MAG: AAA family ATPase [Deltaproteobacteria bacterium]|nr:AAA family ATPase [Deltaproteobacteria bacterium]
MAKVKPLTAEELCSTCDPKSVPFNSTGDVKDVAPGVIGQERAVKSLDFGLGLMEDGYNIYVLGESGTGKTSIVKARLEEKAAAEHVPDDWCYVYNFSDPDRPNALSLPPGTGVVVKEDMNELVEKLRRDIPRVFESKDYEKHRDEIIEGQQERTKALFHKMEQKAQEKGFILKKSVSGLAVVPAKDGKPIGPQDYDAMPKAKKAEIEEESRRLQDRLNDVIREARGVEQEAKDRIIALDREVVQYVVNPLMNELLDKYKDFAKVVDYLNGVREDILRNIDDFRPKEEMPLPFGIKVPKTEPSFERYAVNLLVSNRDTRGAPVVVETNPTYYNLFGRVEHRVQYGVAVTDFTMIKAGSVHRANGGYLVIDAMDMLKNIFVYDALKRTIKNGEVGIEDVWEQYRLLSTSALKPAPIPVEVKVVIIGEPFLYYLLYNLDPEYRKLFKVKADFDNVMPRTVEHVAKYAHFMAAKCREKNLPPFDRSAVARVVDYGSRLAGDREKLSSRFGAVENLIIESGYWAGVEKSASVTSAHVDRAVREARYRNSKVEDKIREFIKEDTIMVSTDGAVAGQVNGIAVLDMGDYAFGKPSRITAMTFMGDEGLVSIEREVKMSGRIHNKAQMILSSFIGERFGRNFPLTLSASICFEQLYEEIEGDSATCAELYAIFSSLSGVPISQGIAVTGSMNQKGEVQPIGGINQKIEGFFDVCSAKGLTGRQGVIMPRRNVKNLMLKQEVIEAVEKGSFSIYPIEMVDEGLEILTATPVGERDTSGNFPDGTMNSLVEKRLKGLAKSFKEFGREKAKATEKSGKKEEGNKGN